MHTRSVAEWEEFGLAGEMCHLSRESGTSAGRSPCERSPTTRGQGDMVEAYSWGLLHVSYLNVQVFCDGIKSFRLAVSL